MMRLLWTWTLLLAAGTATAQSREHWMRLCQERTEEPAAIQFSLCTAQYVDVLCKNQSDLLKKVRAKMRASRDEGVKPESAVRHLETSQRRWAEYVAEHCLIAEDMFGLGNAAGSVYPSCMAAEYELRNTQLRRMLVDDYWR